MIIIINDRIKKEYEYYLKWDVIMSDGVKVRTCLFGSLLFIHLTTESPRTNRECVLVRCRSSATVEGQLGFGKDFWRVSLARLGPD